MKSLEDKRKERNKDMVERMKKGERLSSFDAQSSWFPQRPLIEKDEKAIKELYGDKDADKRPKIHKVDNE